MALECKCENCIHRDVCKQKEMFGKILDCVSNVTIPVFEQCSPNCVEESYIDLRYVDWIRVNVDCKFYMKDEPKPRSDMFSYNPKEVMRGV